MRYDARNQVVPESRTSTEAATHAINCACMEGIRFPTTRELADDIRELYDRGFSRPLRNLTDEDIEATPDPRGYVRALIDGTGLTVENVCERDYSTIDC